MENTKSNRRNFIKTSTLGALGMITVPDILTCYTGSGSSKGTISEIYTQEGVKGLSFATPESQGIPSDAILSMLETLESKQFCLHSFILIRQGAFEGRQLVNKAYAGRHFASDR